MNTDSKKPKEVLPNPDEQSYPDEDETERTGLNEDPEMRKIHDANLDDSFDRAESELDD